MHKKYQAILVIKVSQRKFCVPSKKNAAKYFDIFQKYVTMYWLWGHSSVGRAFEWHSKGQGFDSPCLHHR